ncbi:diguanylate cyclase domain-containing protein [Cellvibrio sp.]|uniref:diguanylate cyclase domain-containing protein n=1 Tax=Cellvibrio sp. TaxID=1965322 RepID=UPI00396479B6
MDYQVLNTELLENVLDALPDGILIVSSQRQVVYTNVRFREMWHIPQDIELADEGRAIMQFALSQLVDPEGFMRIVEALHQTTQTLDDEIRMRDGRVFRRRSVSFLDRDLGQSRIWIFTDVTSITYSHIDTLTGLLNRNKFERHFSSLSVAASPELVVGIAIFDLDHFKLFNDTYGHSAGDDVLRNIGKVISEHLQRTSDAAYRVGGEEFFLQYHSRTREDVIELMNNIRSAVEALNIPHKANPPYNRVTISCGFGVCTQPKSPEFIYRQVDNALYKSKANGRNQITLVELDELSYSI